MKFYYPKLPTRNGKFVELPLIDAVLPIGRYLCLIDSGAEFCYLYRRIGELLVLRVRERNRIKTHLTSQF